jgi:hypothetical protein
MIPSKGAGKTDGFSTLPSSGVLLGTKTLPPQAAHFKTVAWVGNG